MGFWGGLGKLALKAAPIAASFIPGVGPLAAMGIGAAAGGASKKLEGGSWGDAAGGALGGAATAGLGSAIKGGIGPSKGADFMGPQQSLGSKMGNMPWGKIAKYGGLGVGGLMAGKAISGNMGNKGQGQGIGPSYGGWENRTPNMENYIQQGRQEAMMGQPWRQQRGIFPQQMPQYNPTQMPPWLQQGGGGYGQSTGSMNSPAMRQMGGQGGGMGPNPQMMQQMMQRMQMQPQGGGFGRDRMMALANQRTQQMQHDPNAAIFM